MIHHIIEAYGVGSLAMQKLFSFYSEEPQETIDVEYEILNQQRISDMTPEIKIGDRVAAGYAKYSGIVIAMDEIKCKVRFADDGELWFSKDILHHSDLPDYDRKTAFLQKLGALLKEYDAEIRWSIGLTYEDRTQSSANIEVHSPDFDHYFSGETGVTITADNIMDFEKE